MIFRTLVLWNFCAKGVIISGTILYMHTVHLVEAAVNNNMRTYYVTDRFCCPVVWHHAQALIFVWKNVLRLLYRCMDCSPVPSWASSPWACSFLGPTNRWALPLFKPSCMWLRHWAGKLSLTDRNYVSKNISCINMILFNSIAPFSLKDFPPYGQMVKVHF